MDTYDNVDKEQGPPEYYPPDGQPGYMHMHQNTPPPNQFYPNAPQYNQNTMVVNTQPQATGATVIVQSAFVPRPSNYMVLSCLIFWCCNPLFGFIAFIFSLLSSTAYDEGNYTSARSHGKVALTLNIIGLVITLVLLAIIIVAVIVNVTNQPEW